MLIIYEKPITKTENTNEFNEKTKPYEFVGSVIAGGVILTGSYLSKNPNSTVGKLYNKYESTILAGCNIGCGLVSMALVTKNAHKITDKINITKVKMNEASDDTTRNRIKMDALTELGKMITPILIFQGLAIGATVKMKQSMDLKDSKISELTEALTLANTTITTYKNFKDEMIKEVGEKKVQEVEKRVAQENKPAEPSLQNGQMYRYYDEESDRYFDSRVSPAKFMEHINYLNDVWGKNGDMITITYQDVFSAFHDDDWITTPDRYVQYGWVWRNEWNYDHPYRDAVHKISVSLEPMFKNEDNCDYGILYTITMNGYDLDRYW